VTELKQEAVAWYKYLDQGECWIDAQKVQHSIESMTDRYRRNAVDHLLRISPGAVELYNYGEIIWIFEPVKVKIVIGTVGGEPVTRTETIAIRAPCGDAACDAVDEILDVEQARRRKDPVEWMKTTPLYRALMHGLTPTVHPEPIEYGGRQILL
jgi:hypothetical protein